MSPGEYVVYTEGSRGYESGHEFGSFDTLTEAKRFVAEDLTEDERFNIVIYDIDENALHHLDSVINGGDVWKVLHR